MRTKPSKFKNKKAVIGILGLAISVAGTVAKSMWDRFIAPFELEVDAQYIDAAGANHPAAGAVLALPVVSAQTTDEGGRAYWKDLVPHWTEQKRIAVDPPYEIVSAPPFFLRRYSNPLNVLLRKTETQKADAQTAPAAAPTPEQPQPAAAPPAAPPAAPKSGAAAVGLEAHRTEAFRIYEPIGQLAERAQLNAKALEVAKTPGGLTPLNAAPAMPDVTHIYRSGPQISGVGKNYSENYALCSSDPPKGYVVKSSRFLLAGDRQCGHWATCNVTRNEATKVCWGFSLEGHEEQTGFFRPGETGQAYSEGVLTVVWTRATK